MTPDVVESKTDDGNTHHEYLLVSPPPATMISDHPPQNDDNVESRWSEHRIVPVDVHRTASKVERKEDEKKKDEGATTMMNKTTSKQASPYRWSIPSLPHPDDVVQVSRSPFSKYGIQDRLTTSETRTTTTTSSTTTSSCSDSSSGGSNFGTSGNRSTSPRSSSPTLSNASLPKVTLESQVWTKLVPRRLVIPVEHIGHLRKLERENIVQWYQQQQDLPSLPVTVSPKSNTSNSDGMEY
jgi:hypothetical protein